MCEWYDTIVNTDMKPEIKTANLKMLRNYIGMVDDIKIWVMLNQQLENPIKSFTAPKITCVGGTLIYLMYGYCVFLTIANLIFLEFIL